MKTKGKRSWLRLFCCGLGLSAALGLTGCQIDVGGQTLPSGYYLQDDVQFFFEGPEFKLSEEAAYMKRSKARDLRVAPAAPPAAVPLGPAPPAGPLP